MDFADSLFLLSIFLQLYALVFSFISFFFFFFNDTATTEIYTLSLHDALPISRGTTCRDLRPSLCTRPSCPAHPGPDRKSTRLNSSHANISYAVFCLKKKKKKTYQQLQNKQEPTTHHKNTTTPKQQHPELDTSA